jgi:hypothetical protein
MAKAIIISVDTIILLRCFIWFLLGTVLLFTNFGAKASSDAKNNAIVLNLPGSVMDYEVSILNKNYLTINDSQTTIITVGPTFLLE